MRTPGLFLFNSLDSAFLCAFTLRSWRLLLYAMVATSTNPDWGERTSVGPMGRLCASVAGVQVCSLARGLLHATGNGQKERKKVEERVACRQPPTEVLRSFHVLGSSWLNEILRHIKTEQSPLLAYPSAVLQQEGWCHSDCLKSSRTPAPTWGYRWLVAATLWWRIHWVFGG